MINLLPSRLRSLLPLVVLAACVGVTQEPHLSPEPAKIAAYGPPTISIQSPTADAIVEGIVIIRFRAENIGMASPFLPTAQPRGAVPVGHLHVSVDGAPWHWIHASTDPVVVTPLPLGEHTVTLELAGADHRPLDSRSVRFTVVAKPAPRTDRATHH